ncbi:MAG: transcriptional regulator, TetR family [Actinomycetia bacterium]|nr:transcriptional regulator, TetR family [Actinomycetes bacterium]
MAGTVRVSRARKAPVGVDVRVALLDAAGELLSREGPGALTTRRLAGAAGTTTQSIYTLFGGKEGIVRAMFREGYARLEARIRRVRDTDKPMVDLREQGRAYRAAALASPHYYDVMFGHPVPEFTPNDEDVAASTTTLLLLERGVQRCIDAGELVPGADANHVAQFLWAAAHGLVSLELVGFLDLGPRRGVSPIYDEFLAASLHKYVRHSDSF